MAVNTTPPIVLDVADRLAFGAYADVFVIQATPRRVAKLFRRKELDPDGIAIRAVFEAEVGAFQRASAIPDLASMLPAFWGTTRVARVIGSSRDLTQWYHLDCCYVIDFVDGDGCKLTGCREYEWVRDLADQFAAHRIGHIEDASIFPQPDGTFRLIDVATHDASLGHRSLLFDGNGDMRWDVPEGPGDPGAPPPDAA